MRGFQEEISPPSGETWWILESCEKNSQQLREMDILDSPPTTIFTKPDTTPHL